MLFAFKRRKVDRDKNRFADEPATYHQAWERKALPDPGANNYAYMSLDLPPFTPVGAGVGLSKYIRAESGPLLSSLHTATIAGIPTVSGQIISQPLFASPNESVT